MTLEKIAGGEILAEEHGRQTQGPASHERISELSKIVRGDISEYFERGEVREFGHNREITPDEVEHLFKNASIFVVDDSPFLLKALKNFLGLAGCVKVKGFSRGEDVLAAMLGPKEKAIEVPDVIVTDTDMPGMDGITLHRRISAAGLPKMPVVVAMSGKAHKREEWGDVPFLEKPFKASTLFDEIKKGLVRRRKETRG